MKRGAFIFYKLIIWQVFCFVCVLLLLLCVHMCVHLFSFFSPPLWYRHVKIACTVMILLRSVQCFVYIENVVILFWEVYTCIQIILLMTLVTLSCYGLDFFLYWILHRNMQSQLDIVEPAMRCSTYEKKCESTTFPRPSTLFIHQSSQLIHHWICILYSHWYIYFLNVGTWGGDWSDSMVYCWMCMYMSVKVLSHTATLRAVAFTVYTPVLVNGVQLRKFIDINIKYHEN